MQQQRRLSSNRQSPTRQTERDQDGLGPSLSEQAPVPAASESSTPTLDAFASPEVGQEEPGLESEVGTDEGAGKAAAAPSGGGGGGGGGASDGEEAGSGADASGVDLEARGDADTEAGDGSADVASSAPRTAAPPTPPEPAGPSAPPAPASPPGPALSELTWDDVLAPTLTPSATDASAGGAMAQVVSETRQHAASLRAEADGAAAAVTTRVDALRGQVLQAAESSRAALHAASEQVHARLDQSAAAALASLEGLASGAHQQLDDLLTGELLRVDEAVSRGTATATAAGASLASDLVARVERAMNGLGEKGGQYESRAVDTAKTWAEGRSGADAEGRLRAACEKKAATKLGKDYGVWIRRELEKTREAARAVATGAAEAPDSLTARVRGDIEHHGESTRQRLDVARTDGHAAIEALIEEARQALQQRVTLEHDREQAGLDAALAAVDAHEAQQLQALDDSATEGAVAVRNAAASAVSGLAATPKALDGAPAAAADGAAESLREQASGIAAQGRQGVGAAMGQVEDALSSLATSGAGDLGQAGELATHEASLRADTASAALDTHTSETAARLTGVVEGVRGDLAPWVDRTTTAADGAAAAIETGASEVRVRLDTLLADRDKALEQAVTEQLAAFGDNVKAPADQAFDAEKKAISDRTVGIFKAMDGWGTDVAAIHKHLRETPAEGMPWLVRTFNAHYEAALGGNLEFCILDEMSGTEADIALAYTRGERTKALRLELADSTGFFNDDEARIEAVLRAADGAEISALTKDSAAGPVLKTVQEALGGEDKDVVQALLDTSVDREAALARADAIRLFEAMDGVGTDNDAVYKTLEGAKTPEQRAAISKAFGTYARKRGSDWAKGSGDALTAALDDDFSGTGLHRAKGLATGDKAMVRAAKAEDAAAWGGTAEEDLFDQLENKDMTLKTQASNPIASALLEERKEKAVDEQARMKRVYQDLYGRSMESMLDDELGKASGKDNHEAQVAKSLLDTGEVDTALAIQASIDGVGTHDRFLKKSLEGKSAEEVAKAMKDWEARYGGGEKAEDVLLNDTFSELSGEEAHNLRKAMLGKAETAEDHKKLAELDAKYARGNAFSQGLMEVGYAMGYSSTTKVLATNESRMNEAWSKLSPEERQQKATESEAAADFIEKAEFVSQDAEAYGQALDSMVDTLVVTFEIVAGALATLATAGAASPALAAALAQLAVGATGVALRAYALGDRMGYEKALVEGGKAIVGALTAGAGELKALGSMADAAGEAVSRKAVARLLADPEGLKAAAQIASGGIKQGSIAMGSSTANVAMDEQLWQKQGAERWKYAAGQIATQTVGQTVNGMTSTAVELKVGNTATELGAIGKQTLSGVVGDTAETMTQADTWKDPETALKKLGTGAAKSLATNGVNATADRKAAKYRKAREMVDAPHEVHDLSDMTDKDRTWLDEHLPAVQAAKHEGRSTTALGMAVHDRRTARDGGPVDDTTTTTKNPHARPLNADTLDALAGAPADGWVPTDGIHFGDDTTTTTENPHARPLNADTLDALTGAPADGWVPMDGSSLDGHQGGHLGDPARLDALRKGVGDADGMDGDWVLTAMALAVDEAVKGTGVPAPALVAKAKPSPGNPATFVRTTWSIHVDTSPASTHKRVDNLTHELRHAMDQAFQVVRLQASEAPPTGGAWTAADLAAHADVPEHVADAALKDPLHPDSAEAPAVRKMADALNDVRDDGITREDVKLGMQLSRAANRPADHERFFKLYQGLREERDAYLAGLLNALRYDDEQGGSTLTPEERQQMESDVERLFREDLNTEIDEAIDAVDAWGPASQAREPATPTPAATGDGSMDAFGRGKVPGTEDLPAESLGPMQQSTLDGALGPQPAPKRTLKDPLARQDPSHGGKALTIGDLARSASAAVPPGAHFDPKSPSTLVPDGAIVGPTVHYRTHSDGPAVEVVHDGPWSYTVSVHEGVSPRELPRTLRHGLEVTLARHAADRDASLPKPDVARIGRLAELAHLIEGGLEARPDQGVEMDLLIDTLGLTADTPRPESLSETAWERVQQRLIARRAATDDDLWAGTDRDTQLATQAVTLHDLLAQDAPAPEQVHTALRTLTHEVDALRLIHHLGKLDDKAPRTPADLRTVLARKLPSEHYLEAIHHMSGDQVLGTQARLDRQLADKDALADARTARRDAIRAGGQGWTTPEKKPARDLHGAMETLAPLAPEAFETHPGLAERRKRVQSRAVKEAGETSLLPRKGLTTAERAELYYGEAARDPLASPQARRSAEASRNIASHGLRMGNGVTRNGGDPHAIREALLGLQHDHATLSDLGKRPIHDSWLSPEELAFDGLDHLAHYGDGRRAAEAHGRSWKALFDGEERMEAHNRIKPDLNAIQGTQSADLTTADLQRLQLRVRHQGTQDLPAPLNAPTEGRGSESVADRLAQDDSKLSTYIREQRTAELTSTAHAAIAAGWESNLANLERALAPVKELHREVERLEGLRRDASEPDRKLIDARVTQIREELVRLEGLLDQEAPNGNFESWITLRFAEGGSDVASPGRLKLEGDSTNLPAPGVHAGTLANVTTAQTVADELRMRMLRRDHQSRDLQSFRAWCDTVPSQEMTRALHQLFLEAHPGKDARPSDPSQVRPDATFQDGSWTDHDARAWAEHTIGLTFEGTGGTQAKISLLGNANDLMNPGDPESVASASRDDAAGRLARDLLALHMEIHTERGGDNVPSLADLTTDPRPFLRVPEGTGQRVDKDDFSGHDLDLVFAEFLTWVGASHGELVKDNPTPAIWQEFLVRSGQVRVALAQARLGRARVIAGKLGTTKQGVAAVKLASKIAAKLGLDMGAADKLIALAEKPLLLLVERYYLQDTADDGALIRRFILENFSKFTDDEITFVMGGKGLPADIAKLLTKSLVHRRYGKETADETGKNLYNKVAGAGTKKLVGDTLGQAIEDLTPDYERDKKDKDGTVKKVDTVKEGELFTKKVTSQVTGTRVPGDAVRGAIPDRHDRAQSEEALRSPSILDPGYTAEQEVAVGGGGGDGAVVLDLDRTGSPTLSAASELESDRMVFDLSTEEQPQTVSAASTSRADDR